MSTIAYATLTERRDEAVPGTSSTTEKPGVGTWVDALAALVPAEVLAAHGVLLSLATKQEIQGEQSITTITDPGLLRVIFFSLIALSIVLYVASRLLAKHWDRLDYARMLIPALAFIGWTMLQKSTASGGAQVVFSHSGSTSLLTSFRVTCCSTLRAIRSSH